MKMFLSITPVVMIVMIIQSFTGPKKINSSMEEMWAGNIQFRQITYDTSYRTHVCGWEYDTSWSEWRMQAAIINNKGTAKSSTNGRRRGSSADTCVNVNGNSSIKDTTYASGQAPTELVLSIDDVAKEYHFTVDIPACIGKKISDRINNAISERVVDDFTEGDSQILVERYKLGKDRTILTGRIEQHDHPQKGIEYVQIWEWNLKKIK